MIDLLIAGGGPAGLGTAIHAALAGLEAVVVEPRRAPIDKACGEGLMPPAVRALAAMGVAPAESFPFRGIRYVDGALSAEGHFPRGESGLGVRRTALYEALLARATELGVRIVEGRVASVRQRADSVEAAGLRARWLVAADGLHSPLRRALGMEVPPPAPHRYGLRQHFRAAPWTDMVEVHWSEDAEAYVTPVARDLVGVAILFSARGPRYPERLARFPALRERLGEPAGAVLGAGPFERRARRPRAGRVFFVGDAAGFLDPITGEGVRLALAAGRALVECVRAGRPGAYEASWNALVRRYWLFTAGLLRLRRAPLTRGRIVPVLRRFPRIFDVALRVIAG